MASAPEMTVTEVPLVLFLLAILVEMLLSLSAVLMATPIKTHAKLDARESLLTTKESV